MIACLEEVNAFISHQIDNSVLLGQPSRPNIWHEVLQRFWFAHSGEWITQDGLHQLKHAKGYLAIGFHPIAQVFTKLWLEYRDSIAVLKWFKFTLLGQGPSPGAALRRFAVLFLRRRRVAKRSTGAWRFSASAAGARVPAG